MRGVVREKVRILYVAANPQGTPPLQIDAETRKIREEIRQARHRDAFVFDVRLAVQVKDLQNALMEERPHVVHFSGHGTNEAILLQDEFHLSDPIETEALATLLRIIKHDFKHNIRLIVLNACDSKNHAEELRQHVDCVIGMHGAISDNDSVAFAAALYRFIVSGCSVKGSFDLACKELKPKQVGPGAMPGLFVRPRVDPSKVVLAKPEAEVEPQRMRRWLRSAAVAAGAMIGGSFAISGDVSHNLVTTLCSPVATTPLGPMEPFPPDSAGVLVVAPSAAKDAGQKLCNLIQGINQGQFTPCAVRPEAESKDGAALTEAERANASLLLVLTPEGKGSISPLRSPELAELLDGMPPLDIASEDARDKVAATLHTLALLGASRDANLPEEACPPLDRAGSHRLALVVALLVPTCFPQTIDPALLMAACDRSGSMSDRTCALAAFLYLERLPTAPDVEQQLMSLRDGAPEAFRRAAMAKLALHDCENRRFARSAEALLKLSAGGAACVRMTLVEVAACLIAARAPGMDVDVASKIREIEGLPVVKDDRCSQRQRALVLGQRAFWRGRSDRWGAAAEDYRCAYALSHDPGYVLNQAESLLHDNQPTRAYELLEALKDVRLQQPDDMYLAILRWIAVRDMRSPTVKEEAGVIVDLYSAVRLGSRALPGGDTDLRAVACPGDTQAPCVYNLLERPKSSASLEQVRRTLMNSL